MPHVLSILICTLNDRIVGVPRVLLSPRDDVRYLVSFQYTDDMFLDMVPAELRQRTDVSVLPYPATGLSANRNNSLRHCRTTLALISDDDASFTESAIDNVLEAFRHDHGPDILVFSDQRIVCRMTPRLPAFDTRFGLGAEYLSCGEEEVFIHQAEVYGLHVERVDHPLESGPPYAGPWVRFGTDKRVRRSWGALQYMTHRTPVAFWSICRKSIIEGYGWRGRWRFFRDLYDGLRYIMRHPLNASVADEVPFDFQPLDIWRLANSYANEAPT